MDKQTLIKNLNFWDSEKVIIFSKEKGNYYEIKSISRGLGKGIIIEIE